MPSTITGPGDPQKITAALQRTNLSRRAIALRCGVSDTSIGNWAAGHRKPAAGNLVKLAKALGINVRELLK